MELRDRHLGLLPRLGRNHGAALVVHLQHQARGRRMVVSEEPAEHEHDVRHQCDRVIPDHHVPTELALVAPQDADSWFTQARAVLEDPASYSPLGAAAAALVREKYAQEVTLPALAERFGQLVEGSK